MGVDKINDELPKIEARILGLTKVLIGLRAITTFAAPVCSFWLIWQAIVHDGVLAGIFGFFVLSLVYGRLGIPIMFAVSASVLHFHFRVIGLWLPVTAYIVAALTLLFQISIFFAGRKL